MGEWIWMDGERYGRRRIVSSWSGRLVSLVFSELISVIITTTTTMKYEYRVPVDVRGRARVCKKKKKKRGRERPH